MILCALIHIRDLRLASAGRRTASQGAVLLLIAAIALALAPAVAVAESTAAMRIEAMANFLARAESLTVTADCGYDVVQTSGEKIEFGERRTLALRRPDRARVDVSRRDGARSGIVFDGNQLTAFDLDEKVYHAVAKPGSVEAALDYYTKDLGMRLPMRELFSAALPQKLAGDLEGARLVGEETIGGVATDHVWFRHADVDVQLWIARSDRPLPQRIVITYRNALGQPQYAADFHDWNLKPKLRDATFHFTPQEGAQQIPILTRRARAQAEQPK